MDNHNPDLDALLRSCATLRRRIEQQQADIDALRRSNGALASRRFPFATSAQRVSIVQRLNATHDTALATPRVLVGFNSTNTQTGVTISCDKYSARQIEQFAHRFARLREPKRAGWTGDRAAYGVMRSLFEQHGAIQRHYGRGWVWAIPGRMERTMIAARITRMLCAR